MINYSAISYVRYALVNYAANEDAIAKYALVYFTATTDDRNLLVKDVTSAYAM